MGFFSYDCKEHDEKCLLAKDQHLIAIWGRDISSVMPDDFIQILPILPQFQTFGTEAKLEGFLWSHRGITELISQHVFYRV